MNLPSQLNDNDRTEKGDSSCAIEASGLTKHDGKVTAVDGLELSIPKGMTLRSGGMVIDLAVTEANASCSDHRGARESLVHPRCCPTIGTDSSA